MQRKRDDRGFTLIELLVVVTVIGILAAVAVPAVALTKDTAQEKAAYALGASLQAAMEAYKVDNGAYPSRNDVSADPSTGVTTWGDIADALAAYLNASGSKGNNKDFIKSDTTATYTASNGTAYTITIDLPGNRTLTVTQVAVTVGP